MKKLLLITLLSTASTAIFSQSVPEELIKTFFKEYSKNTSKAIDDIYATNPWSAKFKEGIEELKKEIITYTPDYVGKLYGHELIIKKQVTENFILYSYMVRYDRQPMRFTFEFYKPNDKWFLYSFNIDSDLDEELEQAAKLSNPDLDKK